jgi:hypothetical protein
MSGLKNLVAINSKIWQEYVFPFGLQSHKKSFNFEGVGLEMSLFCVDLMWNDPYMRYTCVYHELPFALTASFIHSRHACFGPWTIISAHMCFTASDVSKQNWLHLYRCACQQYLLESYVYTFMYYYLLLLNVYICYNLSEGIVDMHTSKGVASFAC